MTPEEFEKVVDRTASATPDLVCFTLGLVEEVGELETSIQDEESIERIVEEAGDAYFYLTALAAMVGIRLDDVLKDAPRATLLRDRKTAPARLAGLIKKHVFHGKELDKKRILMELTLVCATIWLGHTRDTYISYEKVFIAFERKSLKRWPNGFKKEEPHG